MSGEGRLSGGLESGDRWDEGFGVHDLGVVFLASFHVLDLLLGLMTFLFSLAFSASVTLAFNLSPCTYSRCTFLDSYWTPVYILHSVHPLIPPCIRSNLQIIE
jgi:hypothetical protein